MAVINICQVVTTLFSREYLTGKLARCSIEAPAESQVPLRYVCGEAPYAS